MRWAVIDPATLIVDNVVIWGGGESLWPTMILVDLADDERCSPGWTYDSAASPRFLDPTPPPD